MAEVAGALILAGLGADAALAGTALIGTVTVGTAVGTAALIGGSLIASAVLARGAGGSPSDIAFAIPKPTDGTQTLKQAMPPRLFGYGCARIAGAYVFFESRTNSYDVIALHHGTVQGFAHWYLHDDHVRVDPTTNVVTSLTFGSDGRYAGNVKIEPRYGAVPETYYTEVQAAFSGTWTTAHRGDGIASAMLRANGVGAATHWTIYPHGMPKLSVVAHMTPVFDPRQSTQVRATPSTWNVSHNPVLQLLDFLTSDDHGLGLDWDTVIQPVVDDLMTQADYCDELVTRADGTTENRYRSDGFAYLTTDPADVMASILSTCDGWMAEGPDGTLALWVGKYVAPTVTLTDDHIIGFTVERGVSDEEAVNEIRITYTPPANDYREMAGAPWQDAASIAELGKIRSQSVSMTWVHSHAQARRLAKRTMARHQARLRGTMSVSLYGLRILGQRWVAIQSDAITDLADLVVEVSRCRVDLGNARVTFDWISVNPNEIDAWDAATEEGTSPPGIYGSVTSAPTGLNLSNLGSLRLRARIDTPDYPSIRYRVGYKLGAGAEQFKDFTEPLIDRRLVYLDVPVSSAGTYTVRVAFINTDGTVGTYTGTSTVAIT